MAANCQSGEFTKCAVCMLMKLRKCSKFVTARVSVTAVMAKFV